MKNVSEIMSEIMFGWCLTFDAMYINACLYFDTALVINHITS